MTGELWPMISVALAASSSALLALMLLTLARPAQAAEAPLPVERAVFLFDDRTLADASPEAAALVEALPPPGDAFTRLARFLAQIFPEFERARAEVSSGRPARLDSAETGASLELRDEAGRLRLSLALPPAARSVSLARQAENAELTHLRETVAAAPFLLWRETDQGEVIWANPAYLARCKAGGSGWPLPVLFGPQARDGGGVTERRRAAVLGAPEPFDVTSCPLPEGGSLNFAQAAETVVRAESTLKSFVQTLSKAYAALPIGLAIFDAERTLIMFNPALCDLSGLSPEFLMTRPSFRSVLDTLRDLRVIPEPRNYGNWRRQMEALEATAMSGHSQEVWSLPDGRALRVSGRPQGDGAVAFMIEDVTEEASLTRSARHQIELAQDLADAQPDAQALFTLAGKPQFRNRNFEAVTSALGLEGEVDLRTLDRHLQVLPEGLPSLCELVSARETFVGEGLLGRTMVSLRLQATAHGGVLVSLRPRVKAGAEREPRPQRSLPPVVAEPLAAALAPPPSDVA